jgi:ParB/RepB/Spo0J family partition protein
MSAVQLAGIASIVTSPEFNAALPIDLIDIRQNARSDMGDLTDLTASINSSGVQQPVIVIRNGSRFEMWQGHRRLAASRSAGKDTIPVLIHDTMPSPKEFKIGQLVENLQREGMSEQDVYRSCVELGRLGLARKDIAAALGKHPSRVTCYFAPDSCPPEVKELFLAGKLTLGQCQKIAASPEPLATKDLFLGGATHNQAVRKTRQKPEGSEPGSKGGAVRIDLPNANIIVKGPSLTLASIAEILATAHKAAEKGNVDGLTARSFSNVMRDLAKKPPGEKKAKKPKAAKTSA